MQNEIECSAWKVILQPFRKAVSRSCGLHFRENLLFCFVTLANHSFSLHLEFSYGSDFGGQKPYNES